MYADESRYMEEYEDLPNDFHRLMKKAERMMDNATTGFDGVKKLKSFFPIDPDDADAVQVCACELVNALDRLQQAEASTKRIETPNGVHSGVISSMSAGNESISFARDATAFDKAIADPKEKERMFRDIIEDNLRGVSDCNGVSLLYMGRYPR